MPRFPKVLLALLVAAFLVVCAKAELVELNASNFHSVVNNASKNVFVMFYAPWCGHCNKMKSTWQDLSDKYPITGDVIIARIDASEHRDIAKEFDVHGFPTLKFFAKNNKSGKAQYEGPRELSAFMAYVSANQQ
ncbi:protein disulfide isomerase [Leishmania tarentolae]|uniref:Protein disulfide isomerase n=1 Tax=Leishmania tarentolae TaxID=5689 RepID=A0A640KE00_LEITA|nr:protein disulfide isomerase [Leishmania tarentolae]